MNLPQINSPMKEYYLILIFRLNLQHIQVLKKKYCWISPINCPSCKNSCVWGHGFVLRYFHGYNEGLWMKRWRCPECGAVHTSRPSEYAPGFQYLKETIYESITRKLSEGSYLTHIPYQIQQYWFKALLFQSAMLNSWNDLHIFFKDSIKNNKYKVTFWLNINFLSCRGDPPHLLFALKTKWLWIIY